MGLFGPAGDCIGQSAPPAEGPIVVGEQRPRFRGLELLRLEAAVDLWAQWRADRLMQDGQPTLTEEENLYRQTLDLSGEASIGHKNLLNLSGNLRLAFEEDALSSDLSGTQSSTTSLNALYDLSALILANGPVPTTAYTRRDESYFNPDFGGSIKNTVTEFGAIAQVRSDVAPTQVQVLHREQEQADRFGTGGFSSTQDSAIVHSEIRMTPNQRVAADYTFDHISQDSGGGGNGFQDTYDQHDATLTHWLTFGAQSRDTLRSSLRFQERTGLYAERISRWDEELTLRHTPRLETRYYGRLENLERQGHEQRTARGSALIRHRLYESLTSTASIGGSSLDVPGEFTSDEVFATGALDYVKRVPYGRLNAGVSLSGTHQENGARGTTVPVVNGTYVFNDPFPLTLNRRNIIPESIVVRDTTRVRVFIEGVDYTKLAFPDRVELTRVVGGAISNGQAVVIDFEVGPEPANQVDSTTGTVSVRYSITEGALKGLAAYATYRQLDQSVDSASPALFVLDNPRDLRYGLEYRVTDLTLTAERQHHDSDISPFDATRLQAHYNRRFSRSSLLSLGVSREEADYRFTGERVELYLATGRWSHKLAKDLDFSVHAQGRQEYHNSSPDIRGFEGGVDISWHRGQTTFYGSIYASMLDAGATSTQSQAITIGLRRAF